MDPVVFFLLLGYIRHTKIIYIICLIRMAQSILRPSHSYRVAFSIQNSHNDCNHSDDGIYNQNGAHDDYYIHGGVYSQNHGDDRIHGDVYSQNHGDDYIHDDVYIYNKIQDDSNNSYIIPPIYRIGYYIHNKKNGLYQCHLV